MQDVKGIILAGGTGSRLFPITMGVSKQLLPVFDKPTIYYPLSTLMLGGIRDVLIISNPSNIPKFEQIFGNGQRLGMSIAYASQGSPRGIAEALLIGANFIGNSRFVLILGDNIFYGHLLGSYVNDALCSTWDATIFGYKVSNPSEYGVITLKDNQPVSLEEKPKKSKSNLAVPGFYCYSPIAVELAKALKPSKRNELEITDLNKIFLENKTLSVIKLGRGTAWLDMGTPEGLLAASNFIHSLQERQGLKIGCIEEIAFNNKWITSNELIANSLMFNNNEYGTYLRKVAEGEL